MNIYILIGLVPVVAAIFCIIKEDRLSLIVTVLSSIITVALTVKTLFLPIEHTRWLFVDGFSKVMLFIISAIYLTTTMFSSTYLNHIKRPLLSRHTFYLFLNLFVFTMLFSVVLNNIGLIWVGIEATTITSALLVAIDNEEASIESSWRYIIIVSVGLVMSLIGVMLLYSATQTLYISQLLSLKPHVTKLLLIGAALTIAGFSTKAGIFPMHTWLADVHGRSIAPVSAIFSAVLLPVALFGVYRILQVSSSIPLRTFSLTLGVLSVVFASIFLVTQKFYKRMYAYSSIENMGMILIGLSLGNHIAFLGAVLLILAHAFAKSSAFYTTGNILSVFNSRQIKDVRGLSKRLPFAAYNLIFASLAVTGAPPFATFLGELFIIYAVYESSGLALALLVVLSLFLSFLSVNYKVAHMSFSESDNTNRENVESMNSFVPILNTVLSFLLIFCVGILDSLLKMGVLK